MKKKKKMKKKTTDAFNGPNERWVDQGVARSVPPPFLKPPRHIPFLTLSRLSASVDVHTASDSYRLHTRPGRAAPSIHPSINLYLGNQTLPPLTYRPNEANKRLPPCTHISEKRAGPCTANGNLVLLFYVFFIPILGLQRLQHPASLAGHPV